jgi:hypothetical protein
MWRHGWKIIGIHDRDGWKKPRLGEFRARRQLLGATSTLLCIKRTLTGAEIDDLIADTCTDFELASERARRRQWAQRIENAARFVTRHVTGQLTQTEERSGDLADDQLLSCASGFSDFR